MTSLLHKSTYARFPLKEQTLFAKRLSFLIKAGVPLVEGLRLIRDQTRAASKIRVFDAIVADVSSGQHLASALSKHRRFFGDFSINLIRVGEKSGTLGPNLAYLAEELRKKQLLRRKVVGALLYPVFILVATLGMTSALTAYIFPKLMPIFVSLHVKLPLITRVLIGLSAYLRHFGIYTLLGLVGLGVAFVVARKRYERLRLMSDRALLRVPIVGRLVRAYNLTNFCRTFELLLRSGIDMIEAVRITAQTQNNRVYYTVLEGLCADVTRGEAISRGLARHRDLFPDLLVHLLSIGETTGNLEESLAYLAEMYEGEVEELTKGLSSAIEPILMLVMGGLVGLIAVSVITPIYDITQHLQQK